MTKQHIFLSLTALTVGLLALAPKVLAQSCSTQYGGTTVCTPNDLTINKQVQNPISGLFVENITDGLFSQGNTVVFKLIVTNGSGETFRPVTITDTVPENLEIVDADFASGPDKKSFSITSDKKMLTATVDELPAGKEVSLFLWTKLIGAYPSGDSFCRDNTAKVTASARPEGNTNSARFCVQQQVLGATTLPVAGFNDLLLLVPFATLGFSGIALLKKRG